nr:LysR family transcriptional regulator [Pseudomonas fulva]
MDMCHVSPARLDEANASFCWEDLRFFLTFCQYQSLAGAARSLQVEHATVARRIAALEQSLNVRLVDRRSRKYELTTSGERIAGLGQHMQAQACAISHAAYGIQTEQLTTITLSVPPSLATHVIAPKLDGLRRQYPLLNLRLRAETQVASLVKREADVALRWGRPTESELVARKIAVREFGFFASLGYLLDRQARDYEFLAYDEHEDGLAQEWLSHVAQDRPVVLRASSLDVLAAAAQAGVGIALLPCCIADRRNYALERVALEQTRLSSDLWLTVHQDIRHVPVVRQLVKFVASCFNCETVV